jgi:hypothetical protein
MTVFDEYFDETYDFYDEGQSENRAALPTAEDIFVSFMRHPNFQVYTALGGLRGEQIRAVYGVAELARKEAANQRRHVEGMAGSENEATERVQRLCQALRLARRQVRSLTKTLHERDEQLAALEDDREAPRFTRHRETRISTPVSVRPTAPATPIPATGKNTGVGRG